MQLYPSRSGILAEFARKKGSKDKKKRKRSLADNLFGTTTAGKLVRGGLLAGGALVAGRKFIPRKPLPDSTINNPIGNLPASGGTSGRSYVKQETYKPGYKPNFVERPVPPKVVKTNRKGTGTTVNQRKQEAWRENKGRNNNSKRKR